MLVYFKATSDKVDTWGEVAQYKDENDNDHNFISLDQFIGMTRSSGKTPISSNVNNNCGMTFNSSETSMTSGVLEEVCSDNNTTTTLGTWEVVEVDGSKVLYLHPDSDGYDKDVIYKEFDDGHIEY